MSWEGNSEIYTTIAIIDTPSGLKETWSVLAGKPVMNYLCHGYDPS